MGGLLLFVDDVYEHPCDHLYEHPYHHHLIDGHLCGRLRRATAHPLEFLNIAMPSKYRPGVFDRVSSHYIYTSIYIYVFLYVEHKGTTKLT